jgi:hypothetical protein
MTREVGKPLSKKNPKRRTCEEICYIDFHNSVTMAHVIQPDVIRDAILEINTWHPNTPLILVLSMQKVSIGGIVEGGNDAVRKAYNALFSLDHIGISDDARKYYLHMCHGKPEIYTFAIRKPTTNYGKTHQRIIKDTFGQQFLTRESSGKYRLNEDFSDSVKEYLGVDERVDLRPLVLYHYWKNIDGMNTIQDLWNLFCQKFGTDNSPFSEIFYCSGLSDAIQTTELSDANISTMKSIVLPDEYGTGSFNPDFWKRFRSLLEERLRNLKWQGNVNELTSNITAALMQDQALFLLGAPGTGKTTIVLEAIIPALRLAHGSENEIGLSYHTITPMTSLADLFGFQGLDGRWIEGPLVKELLNPYEEDAEQESMDNNSDIPKVLFLDEANRIDIEGLLSPLQAAFDRLQKRMEPPNVTLGKSEFVIPRRVWRIFAGNSPASDIGRHEQSRPFKRRFSTIIPPDPIGSSLRTELSFRKLCLSLLEKTTSCGDSEISEPALQLYGMYKDNPGRLEQLRGLLIEIRKLRRVAVTVGLIESILLRASSIHVLQPEGSLDASVCASLGSLVSGNRISIEELLESCGKYNFPSFAQLISEHLVQAQSEISMEFDPIL